MNILLAHNYYRIRGGEDVVYESERDLLRQNGNAVSEFVRHSSAIERAGKLHAGMSAIWSAATARELRQKFAKTGIDIVHVHNTFPLISASIYAACRHARVPVVQTIHNYRWLCAPGTLYRNGMICTECPDSGLPYPAVLHNCYHASRLSSLVAAGAQVVQRGTRVLNDDVAAFIAPTNFCRQIFPSSLIPQRKIVIKPHFLTTDPGQKKGVGSTAIFIGRLSEEKGIRMLIRAWRELSRVPLTIVGNGPLEAEVAAFASGNGMQSVRAAGYKPGLEAIQLLKNSRFIVVPSTCYEVFPRVIVEAFACGVPVIVPSHGAFRELVVDGLSGLWFEPGNEADFAQKVRWAWDHPDEVASMGENARKEFEAKYTADANYQILLEIYRQAIQEQNSVS